MFFFLYRNVYLMLNPSYVMPSVSKHVYLMLNPSYVMPSVSETCVFSAEFILCYAFCIETCKLVFFQLSYFGLDTFMFDTFYCTKVVLNTITLNHQDLFTPYLAWVELNSKLVLCFKYEKLNKSLNTEANLKWSEIEY
jgi:hypothetical protein